MRSLGEARRHGDRDITVRPVSLPPFLFVWYHTCVCAFVQLVDLDSPKE
jgi:hypothetical protein